MNITSEVNPLTLVNWTKYRRTNIAEMRPYEAGERLDGVSISEPDRKNGSPKLGDMIARNPKNHDDQWLVAAKYFEENFESADGGDVHEVVRAARAASAANRALLKARHDAGWDAAANERHAAMKALDEALAGFGPVPR